VQGQFVRECLRSGKRVYGTQVVLARDGRAAAVITQIKIDLVFLCAEHHPLDRAQRSMMCQFYRSNNISPMVRISHPSASEAAMALDGGAEGIVAPYVETVEQVRELVGAVRYRPLKGELLAKLLSGENTPNEKTLRYLEKFNRRNYVLIGVESVPACEKLEELLSVDGVDGVFIGPHDLSVSMGVPEEYDHPDYLRLIEDVIRRSRARGVGVGVHAGTNQFSHETICRFMKMGMNLVLYASDLTEARNVLQAKLDAFRRDIGDMPVNGTPGPTRQVRKHALEVPLAED